MKKTRKYFAVLLALVMTLTALPLSGLTASAASSGDFVYEVLSETNKTCEITGYTGNATDLVIPSELDGYTVTSIGGSAFANCTSLTNVTIPNSVTSIGSGVFENCESLTSITVTSGNPNYSSENGVLFNKDKTTLILYPIGKTDISYTIPDSVTSIGRYAFAYCDSLTSVDFSDGVTTIEDAAFYSCPSLTSITIPNGVTSIGNEAFSDCSALASITLPDSLTRIGSNAFYGTAYYNNAANWEDGVLYIGNIVYGADLADVIKFREGTVTLADQLYEAEKIYLPRSVKNIGSYSLFIYYDEEKEDYCSSTFYGYAGSFAETYAKAHGNDFVDITPVVKEELVDIGEGYPPELIESIYVDMQFITVAEALSAYVEYFKAKGIEKEAIMLDENGNIIEDTSILCSEGMAISSWDTNNNLYLCGVEPAEESSVPLGDVNGAVT